ncbi:hypothetical protein GTP56_05470 [Duganella sp. FT134W]|uniref:Uncharacterized protein n=1 Tax=Duganella margarita TaxID=2692170 RepID=A0A7X4GYM8_9BURK|nr:hypothetical protein [Duganella margarita]MYM71645.1 hypothetical protein [Duganella margarita]
MNQNIEKNDNLESIIHRASGLDVKPREAWVASASQMLNYLNNHPQESYSFSIEQTALFATARLDWILENTKASLNNIFSYDDFLTLMNCFQSDLLDPYQIHYMSGHLSDDLGLDELDGNTLHAKVHSLSPAQKACLADILERAWRAARLGINPQEFATKINLALE